MTSAPRRCRSPRLTLAALLMGLLAAASAQAARPAASPPDRPRTLAVVAVPMDGASGRAAALVAPAAEVAARGVGRHEVAVLTRLLDPAGASFHEERAATGRAAAAAARKHYDDLEPQNAAAQCNKALKAFEDADLSGGAFDEMIAAWSLRVASLLANSENKAALAELGLMLPSGGRAVFDPNLFAPDFIAQIKSRRAELAMKGGLPYAVDVQPIPALVYVDGDLRGASPLELNGLAPGEHFLTVVAPGYHLAQKKFRAGTGAADKVSLEPSLQQAAFQARVDALRSALPTRSRAAALKALAQLLSVDEVLALGVTARGKEMDVVAARGGSDGRELSYLAETLPQLGEARAVEPLQSFVERVVGGELKPPAGLAPEREGFRWTMRHTGFLLLGLGAGAGGAGVGLGVKANSAAADFRNLQDAPQVNAIWDRRESEGRRWALAADLTYAGAAVLAAVGATLAILGGPDEEAPAAAPKPALRLEEKKAEPARAPDDKKPADAAVPPKAEEPRQTDDKRRAAEEDKPRAAEDEKQRKAEEKKKAAEEKKKAAEDARRAAEEEKQRKAEEKKMAAEEKRKAAEEARRAAEEEKQRKAEEKKKAAEDARRAAEEEKQRKAEVEAAKKTAEETRKAEADPGKDPARQAELDRLAKEEAAAREAEEARKAEAARKAEEKRREDEKRREADRKIQDFDDLRDDK